MHIDSISATVYRKATLMDRYPDFMSHCPLAHKLVVVKTLHGRAEAICSDMTTKDQETRHIRQAWLWVSITIAFYTSTRWFEENTCSARAEDPRSPFSEPCTVHEGDGPRTYLFGQCRCGGIQHMGCCTSHHSCDWLVLGPWGAQAPASRS